MYFELCVSVCICTWACAQVTASTCVGWLRVLDPQSQSNGELCAATHGDWGQNWSPL